MKKSSIISGENGLTVGIILGVIVIGVLWFIGGVMRNIVMVLAILFIIYYVLLLVFGIDVIVKLTGIDTGSPELDIVFEKSGKDLEDEVKAYAEEKQVFNISQNIFGYDDAKTVCSAYGARLATYSEVEGAYNNGAGWCGYGWSDGQMALYPTQKGVYNDLQKKPGHEHDCGRPGVNGGFIANPNVHFGANCYGIKPAMTSNDKMSMETQPVVPKTNDEIAAEKKLSYWQKNIDKLLVAPFNHFNWSRY